MSGIVTVTLSPTVDKSTVIQRLIAEQKLSCEPPKYEPGGGGINVSRALKRLGDSSAAIFPQGGMEGARLVSLLAEEKIEQHVVEVKHATRENFIVVESGTNQQFRFGMPASTILQKEEKALLQLIKECKYDFLVASGSMPPGIGDDFLAKAARMVKKSGAKFLVDTSGDALKLAVEEGVYLLKPNLTELAMLSGVEELDSESADDAARELIGTGKCEVVVVSMGPNGAYFATKSGSGYIPAPAVKKLSTVGAGDSMVAGIVHALAKGEDIKTAVQLGVACGSAATMNPGTELFTKKDVDKLFAWIRNQAN